MHLLHQRNCCSENEDQPRKHHRNCQNLINFKNRIGDKSDSQEICCCRKGLKHDSRMKYQIKIDESKYQHFEKELMKQDFNKSTSKLNGDQIEKMKEKFKDMNERKGTPDSQSLTVQELTDIIEEYQKENQDNEDDWVKYFTSLAYPNYEGKVNFNNFLMMVRNGRSIIDIKVIQGRQNGKLVIRGRELEDYPIISAVYDKRNIFGRHVEIQKIIRFLVPPRTDP